MATIHGPKQGSEMPAFAKRWIQSKLDDLGLSKIENFQEGLIRPKFSVRIVYMDNSTPDEITNVSWLKINKTDLNLSAGLHGWSASMRIVGKVPKMEAATRFTPFRLGEKGVGILAKIIESSNSKSSEVQMRLDASPPAHRLGHASPINPDILIEVWSEGKAKFFCAEHVEADSWISKMYHSLGEDLDELIKSQ